MLRIIRNWQSRDHLRSFQALRSYGLEVGKEYMAIQWHGAYTTENRTIIYFIARQIDDLNFVKKSFDLDVNLIKYENGQYLYDNTKLFDANLPEGTFFFEFNDGYETYYSTIFTVKYKDLLFMASGTWLASGSFHITDNSIQNPNTIILKEFEKLSEYVIFEIN